MDDYSNIILGTSSYDKMKHGNMVSITGDGGHAWGYFGPAYKKLAPRLKTYEAYGSKLEELQNLRDDLVKYKAVQKQIEDDYIESYYMTRLKDLYVPDLLEELYRRFGDNIILLCHEPIDEFCHRRVLADYIELEMGFYIPEVKEDEEGNIIKEKPIRYKSRINKIMNKAIL